MAFQEIKVPDNATVAQKGLAWVDSRFPLSKLFKEHMSEYYAPKNFNFWYFFGSLAIVVLVIQIVTGIFLVMNYKPDAMKAFDSVEYIMREVPWGWILCKKLYRFSCNPSSSLWNGFYYCITTRILVLTIQW